MVMKEQVYEYLRTIPQGKVVTYGQIAEYLGNKNLARVVGNILHNNPDENKYPCYKVVDSRGSEQIALLSQLRAFDKKRVKSDFSAKIKNDDFEKLKSKIKALF